MSTERRATSRRSWGGLRGGLLRSACAIAALGAASAAEVRFEPSIDLAYYSDGNVSVVGTNRQSDQISHIGVGLLLSARTPATTFTGRYAPFKELYKDNPDFDNLAHIVSLSLSSSFSRRSSLNSEVSWTRTERPPVRAERPDVPVTFLPRTRQDRGYVDLGGDIGAGRRSFVEWGVTGEWTNFGSDAALTLEDSDTLGVRAGYGIEIDPSSRLGARIEGRKFTFETRDDSDSESLLGFWTKDLGRESKLDIEAGAVRANSTTDTSTKPRADIRYTRTFSNTLTLEAGVRQDVSADTGVSGMTEDRGVYVSWRPGDRTERFDASVTVYYWNRADVFDDGIFHVRSFQTAESLAWYPGRVGFAVGAFHTYYDQSDVAGATPGLDTNYHSGGVFLRWVYGRARGERS